NSWQKLEPAAGADAIRGYCHNVRGIRFWEAGDLVRAATEYRAAWRLVPEEEAFRSNLVLTLQRVVTDLIAQGRCSDARGLLGEGLTLATGDASLQEAVSRCGRSRP